MLKIEERMMTCSTPHSYHIQRKQTANTHYNHTSRIVSLVPLSNLSSFRNPNPEEKYLPPAPVQIPLCCSRIHYTLLAFFSSFAVFPKTSLTPNIKLIFHPMASHFDTSYAGESSPEWATFLTWLDRNCRQLELELEPAFNRLSQFSYDRFLEQEEVCIFIEVAPNPMENVQLREVLYRRTPGGCICAITRTNDRGGSFVYDMYDMSIVQGTECTKRLMAAMRWIGDGTDGTGSVHVFIAPEPRCKIKPDKFWHKRFLKDSQRHGDERAYSAYRNTIDELIMQAVRSVAAEDLCRGGMTLAELCGGDGSLARKVLACDKINIEAYYLAERNKELLKAAMSIDDSRLVPIQLDVCKLTAKESLMECHSVDIWIASGSTLCGQVGDPRFAEQTIQAIAETLVPNGKLVLTGFTNNYLTPTMISRAGLTVLRASIPASEADGLGKAYGRLAFFILEKRKVDMVETEIPNARGDTMLRDVLYRSSMQH